MEEIYIMKNIPSLLSKRNLLKSRPQYGPFNYLGGWEVAMKKRSASGGNQTFGTEALDSEEDQYLQTACLLARPATHPQSTG